MFQVNDNGRLILTDELGEVMTRVQRQGNTDVTYKTDREIYGVDEKWAYPTEFKNSLVGDCEDISLYKRKLLVDDGVSEGSVLMTICLDPNGQGHCVLCVCTEDTDYILCNNHETLVKPKTMLREGYKFLYRQKLNGKLDEPWDILA